MKTLDKPAVRVGASAFMLVVALAGELPRNLLTWWGWGAFAVAAIALGVVMIVHYRSRLTFNTLPVPLVAFLGLSALSIAWSFYPAASALGVLLQLSASAIAAGIAISLSWDELLRALSWALRVILGLSWLFELIVSVVIRHPVYPVWYSPQDFANPDAKLLMWSRNLLFEGGKIQGVVGNSSLLAMIGLLAVIVFAIQLLSRRVRPLPATAWLLLAIATVAITRSATVLVGLGAVVLVALAVLIVRRSVTARFGLAIRLGVLAVVVAAAITAFAVRGPLLALLGKSSDFTGRFDIWAAVTGLAEQRPAVGWGFIGYWAPWVAPFDHLIVKGGVQVLHAHNAWLDVWLQLGVLGLVVFSALVLSTIVRSWQFSIDRTVLAPGQVGAYDWLGLLPILVITAQLVQSIAESRLLIEGGWVVFVMMAIATKRRNQVGTAAPQ